MKPEQSMYCASTKAMNESTSWVYKADSEEALRNDCIKTDFRVRIALTVDLLVKHSVGEQRKQNARIMASCQQGRGNSTVCDTLFLIFLIYIKTM